MEGAGRGMHTTVVQAIVVTATSSSFKSCSPSLVREDWFLPWRPCVLLSRTPSPSQVPSCKHNSQSSRPVLHQSVDIPAS